jgi:hypothetical protein
MAAEMAVAHLCTAVLMRFADINRPGNKPIMIEHILKPLIENTLMPLAMGYHAAVIQLKSGRQAAKLQRSTMHEDLKRCKTLTLAHTHMFHRRKRKHTMADLVLKRLAIDGDCHGVHVGPVHLHPPAWMMNLSKKQLLGPRLCTATSDLTLKRPKQTVRIKT